MTAKRGVNVLEQSQQLNEEKFKEICQLLESAGYFRARIPALSPFDRVVGGMAWCLTGSAVDVDLDVTFKENPNIKEKIKISENIITALRASGYKHQLNPAQIQGLDFEKLYPVIQQLIKETYEYRIMTEKAFRRSAEFLYQKHNERESDLIAKNTAAAQTLFFEGVRKNTAPQRKYMQKKGTKKKHEEETRVQSVLLEYERQTRIVLNVDSKGEKGEEGDDEREKERKRMLQQKEDKSNDGLIKGSRLVIIMNREKDKIRKENRQYIDEKKKNENAKDKSMANAQKKQIELLRQQIASLKAQNEKVDLALEKLHEICEMEEAKKQEKEDEITDLEIKLEDFKRIEKEADPRVVAKLRGLVTLNETLKKREKEMKERARKEITEWQAKVKEAEHVAANTKNDPFTIQLRKQFEEEKGKSQKIRNLLAEKNIEIHKVQREMDEVLTRPELFQYQTRFIELFSLISVYYAENKKHVHTFNVLFDGKKCIDNETQSLTNVIENFVISMKNCDSQKKIIESIDKVAGSTSASLAKQQDRLNNDQRKLAFQQKKYNGMIEERKKYLQQTYVLQDEMERNVVLNWKLEDLMEQKEKGKEERRSSRVREKEGKKVEKEKKEEEAEVPAKKKDAVGGKNGESSKEEKEKVEKGKPIKGSEKEKKTVKKDENVVVEVIEEEGEEVEEVVEEEVEEEEVEEEVEEVDEVEELEEEVEEEAEEKVEEEE